MKPAPKSQWQWPSLGPAPLTGNEAWARVRRAAAKAALPAAAAVVLWLCGRTHAAAALVAASILLVASAFLLPRVFDRLNGLVESAAGCIGTLLSWLVLVPFFFLVIAPAGIAMRIRHRDPLNRRFPADGHSLWNLRTEPNDPDSSQRQF